MRMHRPGLLPAALLLVALLPGVGQAVPDALTAQLDDAETRLAELDARVSMAVEEYNAAAAQLERLQDQHRATAGLVAGLATEVDQLEDRTAAFVRAMYIRGPVTDLTRALQTDQVTEAGRDLAVIDRLSRLRQAELEQLGARRTQLHEARTQLATQVAAAAAREDELAERRATVEDLVDDQRDEVVALQARITEIEAEDAAEEQRRRDEAARAEAAALAARAAEDVAAAEDIADVTAEVTEDAAAEVAATPSAEEPAAPEPTPSPTVAPSPEPPPAPAPAPSGTRAGADTAVQAALSQLGKPYEYAAAGPDSYDCSGLTMWAWQHAGVTLPHSSRMQFATTTRIDRGDLQPGDLIFFGSPIHHVAMYVGDGTVVEAPYTGAQVRLNERSLSRSDIAGYGRV